MQKKDSNAPHAELGHPSKMITGATGRAMVLHITGTFDPCEDYVLEKVKKSEVSNKAVKCSKILGERLFFNISSHSTPTLGGKEH